MPSAPLPLRGGSENGPGPGRRLPARDFGDAFCRLFHTRLMEDGRQPQSWSLYATLLFPLRCVCPVFLTTECLAAEQRSFLPFALFSPRHCLRASPLPTSASALSTFCIFRLFYEYWICLRGTLLPRAFLCSPLHAAVAEGAWATIEVCLDRRKPGTWLPPGHPPASPRGSSFLCV